MNTLKLSKPKGSKRFFYHYNKIKKCLTVHFENKCLLTDNIVCLVPTESKDNNQQPRKTIQGWCFDVNHTPKLTTIQ